MSTDAAITKSLLTTLADGCEGFAKGADKLEGSDRADLAQTFRGFSQQRAGFAAELEQIAQTYGDDLSESGSVAGTLHRGWMTLKDALSGSDPDGVLDAAEQGEDHAVKEYNEALKADISVPLRAIIERQAAQVHATHDRVRALRNAAA